MSRGVSWAIYLNLFWALTVLGSVLASMILKFLKQGGTMVTCEMSKETDNCIYFVIYIQGKSQASHFHVLPVKKWLYGAYLRQVLAQRWMKFQTKLQSASATGISFGPMLLDRGRLKYKLEVAPFDDFHAALEKAMGKRGSQPKQVLKF
ncbi:hypothetical protein HAX54_000795 [Datura stramonium]|uniref:Uncharacterized protein n=1 Tax=Datura stramonium TaxID=4076 RepID=A0ABS8WU28_DATST|nr:hypothetical protein [Datura stramonium]